MAARIIKKLIDAAIAFGAIRGRVRSNDAPLMLAEPHDQPFSSDEWIFELKYDGYRLRCAKEQGEPRLYYRRGSNVTAQYPEIAAEIAKLPGDDFVLDGELVAFDEAGKPDFETLQRYARSPRERRSRLRYIAFDLISYGELDLRPLPLSARRTLLEQLVPDEGILGRALSIRGAGEALFEEVKRHALEGMVGKRAESRYEGCRSDAWRKICVRQEGTFFVVGFAADFTALHVADENLQYAGRVELGIPVRALREAEPEWRKLQLPKPTSAPSDRGSIWLRPELTCRVRFKQRTRSGRLRDPLLLGFTAPSTTPSPPTAPRKTAAPRARRGRW